jgi:hypothetical protein
MVVIQPPTPSTKIVVKAATTIGRVIFHPRMICLSRYIKSSLILFASITWVIGFLQQQLRDPAAPDGL